MGSEAEEAGRSSDSHVGCKIERHVLNSDPNQMGELDPQGLGRLLKPLMDSGGPDPTPGTMALRFAVVLAWYRDELCGRGIQRAGLRP